jgi:hypothetical protein
MLSDLEPVQMSAGMFAKEVALDNVRRDLGSDMKMSGKPVRLGAGFDLGNPVVLHLRPAGLWFLVEDGRKRRGTIRPKRRGGKKAVRTPQGLRATSSYGRSRGLNTLTDTESDIDAGIERAVLNGITGVLRQGGWI